MGYYLTGTFAPVRHRYYLVTGTDTNQLPSGHFCHRAPERRTLTSRLSRSDQSRANRAAPSKDGNSATRTYPVLELVELRTRQQTAPQPTAEPATLFHFSITFLLQTETTRPIAARRKDSSLSCVAAQIYRLPGGRGGAVLCFCQDLPVRIGLAHKKRQGPKPPPRTDYRTTRNRVHAIAFLSSSVAISYFLT